MEFVSIIGMFVQTHALAIVLAIVASYVVGFLWHGPVFGKVWMKYNKLSPPKKGEMKFSMMVPGLVASGVTAFAQAAMLGTLFAFLDLASLPHVLTLTTLVWLPFTGLAIINNYAWIGRPVGQMVLDAGYYLVSLWVIAAILYYTVF